MTECQSWNLIGCGEGAGFPPHWDLLVWALKLWEHKWFGENSTKTFMPALVLLWRLVITSWLSMSSPRSVPNLWLSLAFFPLAVIMVHLLRQLDPQFPATLCLFLGFADTRTLQAAPLPPPPSLSSSFQHDGRWKAHSLNSITINSMHLLAYTA